MTGGDRWTDYGAAQQAAPRSLHVNHILSTSLLTSAIFDDLIGRCAAAAPRGVRVTRSQRPVRRATVWHYHRPTLEFRLRPHSVATVHHDLRDDRQWLGSKYSVPRLREAAIVHCLNATQREFLEDHGVGHVRIIPHGVDRSVFPVPAKPRRFAARSLRLGFFSRRQDSGVKGEALLAALLDHLDGQRVSFVLMGEGRGREAALVRTKGFAVECWEVLPYRLLHELYARIDMLLILSRFEGGPATLPEALGSGIPVLCRPVGMCPEYVRDGANGLLLCGQPARDGERITALLDGNARDIHRLNLGAFASAPTIPSWDEVMDQWFQLYATVTA
jgi:glycosyltransferase involved in cell wall biosynthesis